MKTFALALGGGGARGLAHIAVIEALDEMDVKPVAIAGTSIGALIGAAYAAGMRGKDIRRHVIGFAHNGGETTRRLIAARAGTLADLFAGAFGHATQINAEKFCAAIPARRHSGGFFRAGNSADGDGRPTCIGRQEVPLTTGTASRRARRLDRHSWAVATGRHRRPCPDRRRRYQSAALRPSARACRLRRRRRRVRALPPAERYDIPSAWECLYTTLLHHGQRHRRREARPRRARSPDPAECRHLPHPRLLSRRPPFCAPPRR